MRKLFAVSAILSLCISFFSFVAPQSAGALSGSQFNPGRIIDDAVFYGPNSMTATQIQDFLNTKLPTCDTNGTQPYGNTTRAAYAASKGVSTPFICLKSYKMNTPSRSGESGLCSDLSAKTNRTAAQIIDDVAKSCGVSPKVLLILLQKEQSLVTDDWPWPIQYRSATGFGCPDTDVCDSQYYGFFNQVYAAARQFKRYRADPTYYNHRAGGNNNVRYHPNISCGSKTVYIENQATAGLYNYTPYTPNSAALNNLYGTGDSCSSYGNRNFWRMYVDWFGSTYTTSSYAWQLESVGIYSDSGRTRKYSSTPTAAPGGKYYVTVKARNWGTRTWSQSLTKIAPSRPNDRQSTFEDTTWLSGNRVTTMEESSVAPGEIATFNFILKAPNATGTYKEYFNIVVEGQSWTKDIGYYHELDVVSPIAQPSSDQSKLTSGAQLLPGQQIFTPEKHGVLILQKDGNLVYYCNLKAVWSSGTAGRKTARATMQSDGNFVLYDNNGSALWHTQSNGNPGSELRLQSDGNIVLYSASNTALWNSSTVQNPSLLSMVNRSLWPRYQLYKNQSLETADKKYRLTLQSDGNLVLYSATKALWSTRTNGKDSHYAVMQTDGNFVLYDTLGRALWNSRTPRNPGSSLQLQFDGNLVIYSKQGKAIWYTSTQGR